MAKVYAALIRKGLKTLEDVPANLRDAVAKLLEEDTNVYATLIIKGRKTIDQVPALLRKQVEEILADLEVEV